MAAEGKAPNLVTPGASPLDAPLQFRARSQGAAQVVELVGSLHSGDADHVRTSLAPFVQVEKPQVVLDLSQLTFIVSAGLSALISAQREARRRGGSVHLAAARPTIANLLRVTRLDEMFAIYGSLQDALAAMPSQN